MTPDLPPELKAALDRATEGLSRTSAARRSTAISQTYRSGGGSDVIRTAEDALTYALVRMPATYAAVAASLHAVTEIHPDFAPQSLLDIGAGPGTATWAAVQIFSSLDTFVLIDANPALRDLARKLADATARLSSMRYEQGNARRLIADANPADLVIASYVVAELAEPERVSLAEAAWAKTQDVLLIVEPGTPDGYARIMALRTRLIAQGAHVIAPCPHDAACPLVAPDWCHFSQRLPRSRAHMQLKGGEVPFEDERFSYVALARTPSAGRFARVLSEPAVTKIAVRAKLCTPEGVEALEVPRRNRDAYARARRWHWGDALPAPDSD